MFILKNEVEFDMAHYLSGYKGKCGNIHGHRYRLIAEFKKSELINEGQKRGMVIDFKDMKAVLKEIADQFDHKLVIEKNEEGILLEKKIKEVNKEFDIRFVNYRPTAEEMARDIFYTIKQKNYPVYSVELFETPKNSCKYMEG